VTSTAGAWEPEPTYWHHRRVAVTGATGFVGSHLTLRLVDLGAEVVVLRRDEVPPSPVSGAWAGRVSAVTGDLTDQAVVDRLLGEYEAQTVFHLGAQSQVGVANVHPASTFDTNIRGTWTVLEAARRTPSVGGVVVASSDKAYGSQDVLPYTEEMPLHGRHPYDVSKACADMLAASYAHSFGLPVAVTRCGNFFGPGDVNWGRLVPGTIRSLLRGERPLIRSDGTLVRDYLHVADGVSAYLAVAEALGRGPARPGQAYNFSLEDPVSVLELLDRLQQAAGTSLEPDIRGEAVNEIRAQALSSELARSELGWAPTLTLAAGLADTVSWYRSFLGHAGGA
jgi:CDP-glucose 4,6-dehydratase